MPSTDSFNLVLGKNPGELLASAKSSKSADMHIYQIAPAPAAGPKDLDNHYQPTVKFLFTGLVPLKLYAVRMGVIAGNGQVVFTETIVNAPQ
jgi:hypothetical protein